MALKSTFQIYSVDSLKQDNRDGEDVPDDTVSDYLDEWK